MAKYRVIFVLGFALAAAVGAMGYKIVRTTPAPVESDRNTVTRLAWIDRSGAITDAIDLPGHYTSPRLSPDGRTALLTRIEPGGSELYSLSLATRQLTRIPVERPQPRFPVWSPDGRRFVYSSNGDLFIQSRALPPLPFSRDVPEDWSADGRWIAATTQIGDKPNTVYLLNVETGSATPLLEAEGEAFDARFSPDGKQVAFTWKSNVYTANLQPPVANPTPVSHSGGHSPAWGSNGELFYINDRGDLVSGNQPLFHILTAGGPEFQYRYGGYSVAPDGRFLVALLRQKSSGSPSHDEAVNQ
jgi:dipeptidyl aminopeptidase/acylaminoacyl peptidase